MTFPVTHCRKTLFVATDEPMLLEELEQKGYEVLDVRALPRTNTQEIQYAIAAWLQGMVEGTIAPDEERRKTLELEARLHGLLVQQTSRTETSISLDSQTIDKLLDFGPSKHTMHSVSMKQIEHAKLEAITPGLEKDK